MNLKLKNNAFAFSYLFKEHLYILSVCLILFSYVIDNSAYYSDSGCSWSSCSVNKYSLNNTNMCGSDTQKVKLKQGCQYNNYHTGHQYFCCSATRKFDKDKCNNTLWWPDKDGNPIQIILNCPFAPPIEQFLRPELVQFFLYTRPGINPFDYKKIRVDDTESLRNSGFIRNAPLKFIIHGFQASAIFGGPAPILKEYYFKLNVTTNVIAVDWSTLSSLTNFIIPCYDLSAQLTRYVGIRSALLLKFILEQGMVPLKDIHVLGHSLGAHAAGFTGKRFFEYTNKKFPRITGFDPAGPSFRNKSAVDRIDRTDADFVDIIHTAISDLLFVPIVGASFDLGLKQLVGTVDFFPNKGGKQPGCELAPLPITNPTCSHLRSFELYAESIKPPTDAVFRGIRCRTMEDALAGICLGPETDLMGACTDIINNGSYGYIYYLTTNAKSPFAQDQRRRTDYLYCPIP